MVNTSENTDAFDQGIKAFENIQGGVIGGIQSADYVKSIADACETLEKDINKFNGFETGIGQLKGDIAEFWHADTFNINSALKSSNFKAVVDRSHDYASPDVRIKLNEDIIENFGLKYLRDAQHTANAQAISHFQRFCQLKVASGNTDLTFEQFLLDRGLNPDEILETDPIYTGQTRVIPSDQLKEAIEYLKKKISKESINRPEQVNRYQETLDNLQSKLKSADGTESQELSTEEALEKATKAKNGSYKASEDGFTTEDLIQFEHILKQGIKAGTSATVITLVLKLAPEIYKVLDQLIHQGYIDKEELKEFGLTAVNAVSLSFVRGFVSAAITTSCKSGILGELAKSISPSLIAGMTVIFMNAISDAIKLSQGKITREEMSYNLSKTVFVTSCAIGLGSLAQIIIPIPFSYLLGNFIGSMVATFVFTPLDNMLMSFCINSGYTFFGIVEQDYVLPDEVIKELGIEIFQYEERFNNCYTFDEYKIDTMDIDSYDYDMIHIMRRGVIGVHKIGYKYY